jgi:hypothetical protein
MMLSVAADSPATLTISSFQRYLEECYNAGYNLKKARDYIKKQQGLNPYVRIGMDRCFDQFMEYLKEEV